MLTATEQNELLNKIAELGGKGFKEEDIVYEGNKLVLPTPFKGNLNRAVDFLITKIKEEDEMANFGRTFNYRPWDGAICAFRGLKKAFGMIHGKTTFSLFGPNPPEYIQVPISAKETEEAPWGAFTIPLLENTTVFFGETRSEYGKVFTISIEAPRKHRFVIEGIFKVVADELATGSIYRGHAIDGQTMPTFLDLTGLDANKIVYSEQVMADLRAHIWSVMRYPVQNKELGLSLKRAILLLGTYGTGKSLAGYLTARVAEENAWTFIMARPGRDNFLEVMQTARLYQPAVVFFEDAETVTGADQTDMISQVLDTFDGIQAKDTSIMVVLTTNHPELIHKGMHRPGRVDAQIEIGPLDARGIETLITVNIPDAVLSPKVHWDEVVAACQGYVPAFVKEVADRAIRYALVRSEGRLDYQITTEDLVHAAQGLRAQFIRMDESSEFATSEKPLSLLVMEAAKKGVAAIAAPSEDAHERMWNTEELAIVQNGHN